MGDRTIGDVYKKMSQKNKDLLHYVLGEELGGRPFETCPGLSSD